MPCLIAAPSSGSGKTLLSLCLAALAQRHGQRLQTFKVGPDYLDPQLLARVSGQPCRNLDTLLCGAEWVRRSFHWHGSQSQLCLVEGVMGLFDGRGPSSAGSSAEVAALLGLPVVLVVEASRQAGSLAALVRGFRDHGPPQVPIAGVVLNRVGSERHRALLSESLASLGMPLLGVLPTHPALELPSRHLGLLPPDELGDLEQRQGAWAALAEEHLNLDQLWPLLAAPDRGTNPGNSQGGRDPISWCLQSARDPLEPSPSQAQAAPPPTATHDRPLPIAIASDAAFHFHYPEASEFLQAVGFEPIPWSPLANEALPEGCQAVVLPGGYPELHAAQLAQSQRSLDGLVRAAALGIPVVAECGGLLLLGQSLSDGDGTVHRMAGVLPFHAQRGELSLGYREAVASGDGLLVRQGERLVGHEFHRWQLQAVANLPALWQLEGWGCPRRSEGWTAPNVHASWLHLHWAGCPAIPWRLAAASARVAPLPPNAALSNPTTASPRRSKSAGG